ncbi:Family of serine hydrolases 3 [Microbotryomycetes sp. JL221]|nr:Family of serine hydrolases 3 [Microbotryomycetes sp. JL221]
MSGKMGAIRRAIKDTAELVYIDPAHILHLPTNSSADFDSTASPNPQSPEETPRAWWFAEQREESRHFLKLDETIMYLRTVMEQHGPFDGVWGFSQGAACAAILTALVENPSLHPAFAASSYNPAVTWPPQQFKFTILSSGFLPLDPRTKRMFDEPLKTPSLHILGRGDTIVGTDRSLPLVDAFADARVEWHDGGHHIPSKASWRNFFKSYLELFAPGGAGAQGESDVPSPAGAVSPPGSDRAPSPNTGKL